MRYYVVVRQKGHKRVLNRIPCGSIYERALFEENYLALHLDINYYETDIEEID